MKVGLCGKFSVLTLGIGILVGPLSGYEPTVPFPEGRPIVHAMRGGDETREAELREALSQVLIEGDANTRALALPFLIHLSRWYDYRQQEDVFRRVADLYGDEAFLFMLDIQQLKLAPHDHRVSVLRNALETGGAELPHGGVLNRLSAVKWIGREGIVELEAVVEEVYPQLTTAEKNLYSLGRFQLEMNLTRGSTGREDDLGSAATRLPAVVMNDLENSELGQVAYEYATEACARNPINGLISSACTEFGKSCLQIEAAGYNGGGPPEWVTAIRNIVDITENSHLVSSWSEY